MSVQPNLFLIGGMRCGSTSLHLILDQHPEIFMTPEKEPMFYVAEELRRRLISQPNKPPGLSEELDEFVSLGRYRTTTDYQALFEGANGEKYMGEASHYLYHPHVAPVIRQDCPGAKIIVSLRDPVERLYSEYLFYRRSGRIGETFEEFLDIEQYFDERGNFIGMGKSKITKGLYHVFLNDWVATFGREGVIMVLFEDFKSRPEVEIQKLYSLLEVNPSFKPHMVQAQPGGVPRTKLYQRLLTSPRLGGIRRRVPKIVRLKLNAMLARFVLVKGMIRPETRSFLEETYRPGAHELADRYQLDLSAWPWV
jgi:hypothetical protein